jgi:nucleotide-binding universal stress UspA family protein
MKDVKTILVPIDYSGITNKVLAAAISMANKFDAESHLLYIAESFGEYSTFAIPHISTDVLAEELLKQAKAKMDHFVDHHRDKCKNCVGSVEQSDDPAKRIVSYAKKNNVDMIVMGTHGYTGIEKTLMGSVAEKVLRTAPCPVTVIRPDEKI